VQSKGCKVLFTNLHLTALKYFTYFLFLFLSFDLVVLNHDNIELQNVVPTMDTVPVDIANAPVVDTVQE
jgi:hypothetical protein